MSEGDTSQSSINPYMVPIRRGRERAAPDYRTRLGIHLEEIGNRLAEMLFPYRSFPAIDLACGPGTALAALQKIGGTGLSVGCDFSREWMALSF